MSTRFTPQGLVHEHSDDCSHSIDGVIGECRHPESFRRPIPDYVSDDPNEWECGLCLTWQMKSGTGRETVGSLGATANSDEPYSP